MWHSVQPERRGRRAFRAALVVSMLAVVAALLAPAAHASAMTVTLVPMSPASQAQGERFKFDIQVHNGGATEETVTVVERLTQMSSGSSLDFRSDVFTVPAGGTQTISGKEVVTSQWFKSTGAYQITPIISGSPAGSPVGFNVTSPTFLVPTFRNVTSGAGLTNTGTTDLVCEPDLAAGAAVGDVTGDGALDIYLPLAPGPAKLYINNGSGHFTDLAVSFGVTNPGSDGRGAVMADYDNDGDQDIYVTNTDSANRLYRNDGQIDFTDVSAAAGVDDARHSTSAAWGDYDNDGWLDLYVANYGACTQPGTVTYETDSLYHNDGDGTFTDVTNLIEDDPTCTAGGTITSTTCGFGFQPSWFDYDKDGDDDLLLGNDIHDFYSPYKNVLWRNDGSDGSGGWTFTEVSSSSGAGMAVNSMGAAIADLNGDRTLDVWISNIGGNVLMRNSGSGSFVDVAKAAGVARPFWLADVPAVTWGMMAGDFNNDGTEDLYGSAGHLVIMGNPTPQQNQMFVNKGGGQFLDLSAISGVNSDAVSRGVAMADFDRDGRLDLYVVNQQSTPVLYRNITSTSYNWLELHLEGTTSNRDACGARLSFTIGSQTRIRQVYCGSVGFASGSDTTVHVGLKNATQVNQIAIKWPSGTTQIMNNVAANQYMTVVEP